MDRGAWWAAVHRVAQSWTRLKRLSSSSSSKLSILKNRLCDWRVGTLSPREKRGAGHPDIEFTDLILQNGICLLLLLSRFSRVRLCATL